VRNWCGGWFGRTQSWPASTSFHHTISGALAPGFVTRLAALEQIQFLLGHPSVETTERYLGSRQRIVHAVNDKLGIEPGSGSTISVTAIHSGGSSVATHC
jgi:hypothetical protein